MGTRESKTPIVLRFEGHSDDTFGEYALFMDDFDCCANGKPVVFHLSHEDKNGNETSLHIYGQYSGKDWPRGTPGCWMIGVQQNEEDELIPETWKIGFETCDNGYSPVLVIELPPGFVTLDCLNRKTED